MSIMNVLVLGLATIGAVQARPKAYSFETPSIILPQPTPIPGYGVEPTSAPPAPSTPPPADNSQLFRDLFSAPTAIKRFQRLLTTKGESLLTGEALKALVVFDFNNAKPAPGAKGGATKAANIETFPILTGLDMSTTMGFLGPCGMNSPHVHPRATEFLTVVEGAVKFGYVLENGLVKAGNNAEISGSLSRFQGTVFPMGSIHYQINEDCAPASFVATLDKEDPGTLTIAPSFFGLNKDVVSATLGYPQSLDGKDINAFRKSIPANIALSIDSCLKKCNIDPNAAPK
ncbi:RmlC-like cupin [Melanomma pulvis-pyrius CBS 109.77]|uniref:RmlC-like cupin n=1 Tax=Melanomma pulvis-pyrius CBS 109.77 TaxID=1314802 RepID=A0A6A6XHC4_9PLEO|nr:RmlC-like cupin [Melanomma pulvis-pyrius CBS 109.77]